MNKRIFVFGSNLAGVHGAGSAKAAMQYHGAIWGQGEGLQGNSYGIATKDARLQTLSLESIERSVRRFIQFATEHPEMTFQCVKVGCGLAGVEEEVMKKFFANAPLNCELPRGWR